MLSTVHFSYLYFSRCIRIMSTKYLCFLIIYSYNMFTHNINKTENNILKNVHVLAMISILDYYVRYHIYNLYKYDKDTMILSK